MPTSALDCDTSETEMSVTQPSNPLHAVIGTAEGLIWTSETPPTNSVFETCKPTNEPGEVPEARGLLSSVTVIKFAVRVIAMLDHTPGRSDPGDRMTTEPEPRSN
jgi:hypothetical protein